MIVFHRQQFGLARGEPVLSRRALALGAVSVAAGIISDMDMATVLAGRDMATQRRRAAALDSGHNFQLAETDVSAIGLTPLGTVVAEDIRDLQGWTGHRAEALPGRPPSGLPALVTA